LRYKKTFHKNFLGPKSYIDIGLWTLFLKKIKSYIKYVTILNISTSHGDDTMKKLSVLIFALLLFVSLKISFCSQGNSTPIVFDVTAPSAEKVNSPVFEFEGTYGSKEVLVRISVILCDAVEQNAFTAPDNQLVYVWTLSIIDRKKGDSVLEATSINTNGLVAPISYGNSMNFVVLKKPHNGKIGFAVDYYEEENPLSTQTLEGDFDYPNKSLSFEFGNTGE
jgi:hypothetical protein